jgi:hypothetical protein
MNNSDVKALVLEYLGGDFTADREKVLESLLAEHGYAIEELNDLKEAYVRLGDIPVPPASEAMTENFYRMLAEHDRGATRPSRLDSLMTRLRNRCDHTFIARVACGLALLCIGWSLGFWFAPNEQYERRLDDVTAGLREVKGMMAYAMLNQSSPIERIRAINQVRTSGSIDESMIARLLNTLGDDPNVNVRLVALETLATAADRDTVRQGLVRSVSQQESPLVQLALTDVLVSLDEDASVGPFRELLERPGLNDAVRTRIVEGLETLM